LVSSKLQPDIRLSKLKIDLGLYPYLAFLAFLGSTISIIGTFADFHELMVYTTIKLGSFICLYLFWAGCAHLVKLREKSSLRILEIMLIGLVVLLFALVLLYTRNKYVSKNAIPEEDSLTPSTGKVLANKFYIDELYDMVFVKPLEMLSLLVDNFIDSKLIGGIISGISKILVLSFVNGRCSNNSRERS
jgi:NADH-quinone oxidoreductase subunit L